MHQETRCGKISHVSLCSLDFCLCEISLELLHCHFRIFFFTIIMITLIYQFNHYCAALIIVSLCSSVQVLFSSMYSDVIFIVCDFLSNRPDHLSCHVKHVHSTERPFKCQVTVRLPLALLHNQTVSLVCRTLSTQWFVFPSLQACTSAFATKDRLRSHMIRHEGKVTCNICGKMLSAAYITSHLKTHGQAGFTSPCNKGMPDLQQFSDVL